MHARALALGIACALPLASAGCPDAPASEPVFDAARAWSDLVHQVELGPRPAGSEANERCRAWIESELRAAGLSPVRETFRATTPAGEIEFGNVYADLAGADPAAQLVVLGSHFDTKRLEKRFVGANDGASSTAVLLEVARALARGPKRALNYRCVFFDGEEAVRFEWAGDDNTYGSRHHAKGLVQRGENLRTKAFVLIDMVGDKDLRLTRDLNSDARYLEVFFAAGRRLGLKKHVDGPALEVRDDHLPFMAANVRSVDLIDFDYGPHNAHWHTEADTLDKCSQASLDAIGRIVLAGLADLER